MEVLIVRVEGEGGILAEGLEEGEVSFRGGGEELSHGGKKQKKEGRKKEKEGGLEIYEFFMVVFFPF